jgi:hypothetical protein
MTIPMWMLLARIGLMICLYGFLASVCILLWKDLRHANASDSTVAIRGAHLLWRDSLADQSVDFSLRRNSNRIGRSPSVEVCLPDDTVSLVHARIWYDDRRWWLEDLSSKNGTQLNDILLDNKIVLSHGDCICVGRCLLEFQTEE